MGDGQFGHAPGVYDLPHRSRGRLEQRRFTGDGDAFHLRANLQTYLDLQAVIHTDFHAVPHILLESRRFDRDLIRSRYEVRSLIQSGFVGGHRDPGAHGFVEHLDGGAGNDGPRRVDHAA